MEAFFARSWCRFEQDETLARWVESALPAARAAVAEPDNAKWLRCGGSWFVGVNALPNDARGAVACGPPLAGHALGFIERSLGLADIEWDRAQISVVYPGYPARDAGDTAQAYRFRRERDAAHVDGILRDGPQQRRYLRNGHAFILGIPLVAVGAGASPLVVWEGSHEMVRAALQARVAQTPPDQWHLLDVTECYHAVRRRVFSTCRRIELAARPGEAYLIHRLALHGIAPWSDAARAGPDARMIAYFRPERGNTQTWLTAP